MLKRDREDINNSTGYKKEILMKTIRHLNKHRTYWLHSNKLFKRNTLSSLGLLHSYMSHWSCQQCQSQATIFLR